MKIMGLYKHKNNTDVAMLVIKSFYVQEKNLYKLKVKWMNVVNPSNVFYTGVYENVEIPANVFHKNWELLE